MNHISLQELNPHGYELTPEIKANIEVLLERINKIRDAYGKPMVVTSGLRSQHDQEMINPSASKSKHLIGAACDVEDKDGKLRDWILLHLDLMEQIGFWFEAFDHTVGWVHFQMLPPGSGKRIFIP